MTIIIKISVIFQGYFVFDNDLNDYLRYFNLLNQLWTYFENLKNKKTHISLCLIDYYTFSCVVVNSSQFPNDFYSSLS